MSSSRAAGPILATVCGVCTAYAAFAPELQKQQIEREIAEKHAEAPLSSAVGADGKSIEATPQPPTIISNDLSIGATVRHDLAQVKSEAAAASQSGWPGSSMFRWAFGGAVDSKATNTASQESTKPKS